MKTLYTEVENLIDNSQYTEAVDLVVKSFNLIFDAKFLENNYHFQGDKDKRDIYSITLKRGARKYTFKFGQSIMKSQHYKDKNIPSRLYTLNGGNLKGGYKINDLKNYESYLELIQGEAPTLYDVLSCLQKYEVGTFEDFCSEFGYDEDSRAAYKTYKAVVKEYDKVCSLFSNDELEVLQLIS